MDSGNAALKQNTDLAYYYSNESVEIAIQVYRLNEGQVSDTGWYGNQSTWAERGNRLLKRWQYLGVVLWYV